MAGAGPPAERSDAADRSRADALRVWANLPATASQDLENRTVSCGLAPCIRSGSRRPFLARIMSSRPSGEPGGESLARPTHGEQGAQVMGGIRKPAAEMTSATLKTALAPA